ncbi:extensin family protein [Enterobacter cloacae complex sp. I1]|uniref:extensin-like domain-containing protein n=1 Tax=Enterobacter TaxID=547 RepID=UPI001865F9A0|nr:extensin family protein [Enterobacter cloacae complex sp. P20C]MBE3473825.1 extensin family protein [Enterobacter cloacae complex sp. P20B]MBE3493965.1 extensin family protein [Enterobacter cloacae complex sp. P17RS]MBE3507550.1 extensin family protein [Enterobacter cloacae complex sp. I10]MBE3526141.1 extensin family protein [Enterobacter cloacae complex sp. I9]MBE3548204.1 extensin family protein [Enterobacter cloacae complex sp. I1]MCM7634139.1 extensin family protein [Enterobacter buga
MKGKTLLTIFILGAIAMAGYRWLPSYYNPFTPLNLDDPPGRITQYKLRHLTPEACASLLAQANQKKLIRTQAVADSGGECPLNNVVRVRDFGPVSLNGSFLASCPLALSSALFVSQQARPLTKRFTGSELTRIEHLGSFACRNIYHRPDARRSEHATAEALDIAAFRLANGERVTVLNGWKSARTQPWLKALLAASCGYYGNGLGPEYNAAHASHFHLGMRGFGLCR